MPDHFGATLTTSNHGDNPTRRVDGMAQVVVRMEDLVAEVWASPRLNIRHKPSPKHDVLGADGPAVDLHGKALLIEGDLAHFPAKFNLWQAACHPFPALIEFRRTDPNF